MQQTTEASNCKMYFFGLLISLFLLLYRPVFTQADCGGDWEVNGSGILKSPNYPGNYEESTTCIWRLTVSPGDHVAIKFQSFKLEEHDSCSYDYVEVRDGDSLDSPLIGKYCGNKLPPHLSSSGNTLFVKFSADHSNQMAGFSAVYMKANCGKDIEVNGDGHLMSPNFPGTYDVNETCIWRLRVPPGDHVVIQFETFLLEEHTNCIFDYVEIRDGNSMVSPLLGKYCGSTLPRPLSSSGNTLLFKFRTDYSQQRDGFSAVYKKAHCGRDIEVNDSGNITSPNYPGAYELNTMCVWRLRVPPGDYVSIKFQAFELQQEATCEHDYVEIRDGHSQVSSLLGKYCGNVLPFPLSSSGNTLLIKFSTDDSLQMAGFVAVFKRERNYTTTIFRSQEHISETNDMTTVYSIGKNISDEFVYVHLSNRTSASLFTSLLVGDRIVDLIEGHQENFEDWGYLFTENGAAECSITWPVIPANDTFLSKYYTFSQFTFLRFEVADCEIELKLILSPTEEQPNSVQRDFIFITSDNCTSFSIYKCNNTSGADEVYINGKKFMCWKVESFSLNIINGTGKIKWFIKQTQGKIIIWSFSIHYTTAEYMWKKVIDSPASMKFFAIHASDLKMKKNVLSEISSWGMSHYRIKNNVPFKGQWFIPAHKYMCMTLIFYTEENVNDVFHIYFEQRSSSQEVFMGVAGKHSKIGWQAGSVLLVWPETIQDSKIRLIMNTSYDGVLIDKVYTSQMDDTGGCVSGDNGVLPLRTDYKKAMNENIILLASTDYTGEVDAIKVLTDGDLTNRKPIHFVPSKMYGDNNQCGFSAHPCPPGFTGADCEQACGKNRFGNDCSSLCSTNSKGCSGLLLCVLSVGCVCPPGYKGKTCEEECETGFYGNNCSQTCGNCKGSACDIYTGKCSLCEPGYYMPLCKHKYAMTSLPPHVNVTTFGEVTVIPDFSNITGKTHPEFYSVEYRKVLPLSPWIKYTTLAMPKNSDPQETIIKSVDHGIRYEVRIVLIDRDHSSFEEDGYIPTTNFVTMCTIPDTALNLQTYSNETSVTVSWQFENGDTNSRKYWCPVTQFEVYWKEGWRWFTVNTTDNTIFIQNQLPSMTYEFKVRALTCCGFTSYSSSTIVSTAASSNVTEPVRNIVVTEMDSHSASIRWEPPLSFSTAELSYTLVYKCMLRSACLKNCSESAGEVNTTNTAARISGLLSFSQYLVTLSANGGPINNVIFATTMLDPVELPELCTETALTTNTSITLNWKKPEICSGIFKNYIYQVYLENNLVTEGTTDNTSAIVDDLIPYTEYKFRVCVQLISGRGNLNKCSEVELSTKTSVPEKVRNLTVYRQGKSMLGIRWARPERVQGTLVSFTVTTELNSVVVKSSVIEPTPCIVWPDLFCHSITSLKPNKRYTVNVSARSDENDGPSATVTGVTREKFPLAPENIQLLDITSTTVDVQWDYPSLVNGVLRSFVLNILETERFEADMCCETYPLTEIPYTEELRHYMTQITGLTAAATYQIGVAAKTIGLGPFQNIVVQTRPPQLPATQPQLMFTHPYDLHWNNISDSTDLFSYDVYRPLIKGPMLLLAVTNETVFNETGIQDAVLDNELKSVIRGNFYLTAEYTDETLGINVGDNDEITDGRWGKIRNIPLKAQTDYQMAAVQVTEYNGTYNVAVSLSTTFTAY